MIDTPWYMRKNKIVEKSDPERMRRHLESLASVASEETDAELAHLRAAEAKGIELSPSQRMSMGYLQIARSAADQLGAHPSKPEPSPSSDDLTPAQRLARGYGA
ncbi:hypothetical protein OG590_17385 [Streptomyces goshikiensis]|uniref:hypothetical protein n=1 Tax=Streptomyces goshikiensis TaxID=1942 RepID=UPI00386BB218|nr:hypothetical protein OG590_17385 [Streptomyces goshikiensis]